MILVDSSVWIDFFNGTSNPQTICLHSILGEENIVMGDLILVEVLQGFKANRDFNKAKKLLSNFPFMEMLGQDLAIKSAENYRVLRKKGVTVQKTIDVIIGTFCIYYSIFLLHHDQDFNPLTKYLGLKVVNCD